MKKSMLFMACVAILLSACKKDVSENTENMDPQLKSATVGSPQYYEDLYDLHIQTGAFGIINLAKNQNLGV